MRASHPTGLQDFRAQLIIAAFDKWQDLRSALELIGEEEGCCFRAVLHARTDLPEEPWLLEAVNEVAELEVTATRSRIARGHGALTAALAAGFSGGARTLAGALRRWMSPAQARQLEDHIGRGRLLLWVQPLDAEQFSCVCGHLVRSSPHVVEVCELSLKTPGRSDS